MRGIGERNRGKRDWESVREKRKNKVNREEREKRIKKILELIPFLSVRSHI